MTGGAQWSGVLTFVAIALAGCERPPNAKGLYGSLMPSVINGDPRELRWLVVEGGGSAHSVRCSAAGRAVQSAHIDSTCTPEAHANA